MIVAQLLGGLGNQLFQYSLGRALAHKNRTVLKLDTHGLGGGKPRQYRLDHFGINAEILSQSERKALGLPAPVPGSLLSRLAARIYSPPRLLHVVRERSFEFDASVLEAPADCYLQGYWQSPRYFAAVESMIRDELEVRDTPAGRNLALAREIQSCLAVSLHVRRGDYVSNPNTSAVHGVCSADYYARAESLLLRRLGNYRIFVFSDDPDWVERELRHLMPATLIRHNLVQTDYEDLRLMSLCKHHIIANSSFSWWSAWLCRNPDKIVIAPQDWFREAAYSTRDLIPDDWLRM